MKKAKQISESIELAIFLALAGGFMDAYSYVCRGGVFANAQTGNILLVGVKLSEGNTQAAIKYIYPILAFMIGIAFATTVHYLMLEMHRFHWRQITILMELAILFSVGFLPQSQNLLANSMTSLACGIQVQSFRKIRGNAFATTMCIGNMRTGTEAISNFVLKKDRKFLEKGILYYGIIIIFVIGAIIGNVCVKQYEEKAMFICPIFLMVGFMLMFIDREKAEARGKLEAIDE